MGKIIGLTLALVVTALALVLMAPSTNSQATTDSCTTAGYFKSCCRPGGYFYCLPSGGRWLMYEFTCDAGYEFDQAVQKCLLAAPTTTTSTTTSTTTTTTTTTTTVAPGGPEDPPPGPGDPTDPDPNPGPEDPTGK